MRYPYACVCVYLSRSACLCSVKVKWCDAMRCRRMPCGAWIGYWTCDFFPREDQLFKFWNQAVYKLHRFGVAVIILSSPRCFLSICHVRPGFLLIGRNKLPRVFLFLVPIEGVRKHFLLRAPPSPSEEKKNNNTVHPRCNFLLAIFFEKKCVLV